MKHILVFAVMIIFASCTKQASNLGELAPQKAFKVVMNFEQVVEVIGYKNAFEHFSRSGLVETITDAVGRVNRKIKNNATVAVWFNDLTLSVVDGIITYSTVPDADFTGVTKFLSQTSNDGALGIWDCGRYWDRTWQTVDPFVTCNDPATVGYFLRAFTSNSTTGDIHVSDWVAG